jgi:hypothetical protein
MPTLLWILVAVFVAGAVIGAYALLAPRAQHVGAVAEEAAPSLPPLEPLSTTNGHWTSEAVEEFAGLSEAARCDLIFAVATLDDERSHRLLLHALDDPADAVALAAAHALARNGNAADVAAYVRAYPGTRADTLVQTLALLD